MRQEEDNRNVPQPRYLYLEESGSGESRVQTEQMGRTESAAWPKAGHRAVALPEDAGMKRFLFQGL